MKFYVQKLGCLKNDVDADYLAARLIEEGHEPVEDLEEAETIIVNTCGFIQAAKEESIDEIIRLAQLKKGGKLRKLYASSCLAQRYGDELLSEMPELDGAFGHGTLDSLAQTVAGGGQNRNVVRTETRLLGFLDWPQRFIADNLPFAYLKISDGCDRCCSYCAVPSMRGPFRSRPLDSIVREAEFLVSNGKKELILVSQESTQWGRDFADGSHLLLLLQALDQIAGLRWIRLLYLYPSSVDKALIEYLAADNKTLNYYDLPLQHLNDEILRAMGRQGGRREINRLLETIRDRSPDAVIRTTFIVGFPGETEDQFEELLQGAADVEFDRLGVFTYSREEGTLAHMMPGQVSEQLKNERMDRLMTLQHNIALRKNNSLIGNVAEVIIDSVEPDEPAMGRTYGDCPEIDQEVYVFGEPPLVGDICRVRIESVDGYDLVGTRITE
jgi:ribosomal protein S12 methylthiotransferase